MSEGERAPSAIGTNLPLLAFLVLFEGSLAALLLASLGLGLLNTFVRPVLLLVSISFIIFTLGFGVFVINALLLIPVAATAVPIGRAGVRAGAAAP